MNAYFNRFAGRAGLLLWSLVTPLFWVTFLSIPAIANEPLPLTQLSTDPHQLLHQGIEALRQGAFPLALQRLQLSLQLYQQAGDRFYEGIVYSWIGSTYDSMGRYDDAIAALNQALTISQEVGDRVGEGTALNQIGLIQQRLGDSTAALEYYQQALSIFQDTSEPEGEATALNNIASIYDFRGQTDLALETYAQALVLYRRLNRPRGEADTLKSMGVTHYNRGTYTEAIALYQQALAIQQRIGDRPGEASTLNSLGAAYVEQGDFDAASAVYAQALTLRQGLGDRAGEASTLNNIAEHHRAQGNYGEALGSYQQSLEIMQDLGDPAGEAVVLSNLGSFALDLGQLQQALEYYQQALEIRIRLDDTVGMATSYNNIGQAYYSQGRYDEALAQYEQSLAIIQDLDMPAKLGALQINIGAVYDDLGDFEQSLTHYKDALEIFQALDIPDRESTVLNNIGYVYSQQGRYGEAIAAYNSAIEIAQGIGDRSGTATTLSNLGIARLRQNNLPAAEADLLEAIALLTQLRSGSLSDEAKISLFDTQVQTYQALQQLYVRQNQPEKALEISENSRTRALVDLLTIRLGSVAVLPASEQSELALGDLDTISPVEAPHLADIQLADIQRIAAQHQATLVEYSWVDACTLYIWVVQPDGTVEFRQTSGVTLPPFSQPAASLSAADSDRGNCPRRGVGVVAAGGLENADDAALASLYDILIGPIADLMPTDPTAHVVIVPHQELFLVPFAALKSPEGRYLIEDHTLITSPSIQVMDLTRRRREAIALSNAEPLIVGNPVMPSLWSPQLGENESLAPLPGAETEAQDIAALLNADALIGAQATESAVKHHITTAPVIHLATHGLLDYGPAAADIPGAIALTPDGAEDGLLTTREILSLSTQAQLIVLSACDTGRGSITGDGVVGLSRAWIAAGASSLVVSLWAIPDAPTAALMSEFYRQRQSNPDQAQALRQAMLQTMAVYPSPQNWAAFTLIGQAH
ncbi:MAG: CHAT domain-containing tetratricopeptide repeat protein [Cyanobacteria bacterium P01_D01_bin.128]